MLFGLCDISDTDQIKMKDFDADKIETFIGKSIFSGNIEIHKSLKSTSNTAKEMYETGAPHGTVILAEEQSAGRGRMDRIWVSPSGKNILVSILLKPEILIQKIYTLTLALALSVTENVKKMTGLKAMIKWPNDIYLKGKKIGGILTEFGVKGQDVKYVILGLGLNVNWYPEKESLFSSTSLKKEYGRELSRNELIAGILLNYEKLYGNIISEKTGDFLDRINRLSLVTGRDVTINAQGEMIRGKAEGIDVDGALLIRKPDGKIRKILNGDVSLRV